MEEREGRRMLVRWTEKVGECEGGKREGGGREGVVSEPDPRKIEKEGLGTSARVEVYTALGMKAHFRLAFD